MNSLQKLEIECNGGLGEYNLDNMINDYIPGTTLLWNIKECIIKFEKLIIVIQLNYED